MLLTAGQSPGASEDEPLAWIHLAADRRPCTPLVSRDPWSLRSYLAAKWFRNQRANPGVLPVLYLMELLGDKIVLGLAALFCKSQWPAGESLFLAYPVLVEVKVPFQCSCPQGRQWTRLIWSSDSVTSVSQWRGPVSIASRGEGWKSGLRLTCSALMGAWFHRISLGWKQSILQTQELETRKCWWALVCTTCE